MAYMYRRKIYIDHIYNSSEIIDNAVFAMCNSDLEKFRQACIELRKIDGTQGKWKISESNFEIKYNIDDDGNRINEGEFYFCISAGVPNLGHNKSFAKFKP